MLNLIKNEYIKVFKKSSNYIFFGCILIVVFLFSLLMKNTSTTANYADQEVSPDFSEQMVKEYITDIKENGKMHYDHYMYEEEKKNELNFLYKIQELKLYSQDEWKYDALYLYVTKHMRDNNSVVLKKNLSSDISEKLLDAIKSSDYNAYLTTAASMVEPLKYDFEGSEDAVVNFYQYCIDKNILGNDYTRIQLLKEVMMNQETLQQNKDSGITDKNVIDKIKEEYLTNKYKLDHDLDYAMDKEFINGRADINFWTNLYFSGNMTALISLFILVIAGGCIASEYSNGTIKFLVINPVKRSKIFWSKYLCIVSLSVFIMIVFYIFNVLLSVVFYGTSDFNVPYLEMKDGVLVATSGFAYVAKIYLSRTLEVICYGTMAFMISSVFKSASFAIGISVASLIAGSSITGIIAALNLDWGRYLIFANTDLESIKNGITFFPNHTVNFAVMVVVVHLVVFILTAYDGFVRREI